MRDSIEELQDGIILLEKLWVTRGTEGMFREAKKFDEENPKASVKAIKKWNDEAEWYAARELRTLSKIRLLTDKEKQQIKKYIQEQPLDPELLETLLFACKIKESRKMVWKKSLPYYENGDPANLFGDPLWDKKLKLAHELEKDYEISFVKAMQTIAYIFLNPESRKGKSYTEKIRREVEWRKENMWNKK